MRIHKAMIGDLLAHVENGGAPLTPEEFLASALTYTADPGTALILCHNVLKAMARGKSPIPWEKVSRFSDEYIFDGQRVDASDLPLHPDASATGSQDQPSFFYRFFSPSSLSKFDEGDWYHYFLEATVACYGANGRVVIDAPGFGISYDTVVGGAVDDTIKQMNDPATENTAAYYGWLWANSLSFLEQAKYGTNYGGDQSEANREATDHMRGAIFGLSLAGHEPNWPWRIARIGSAGLTSVDVSDATFMTIDPAPFLDGG